MSKKLFVVGTGTDVGKTYVTALMVKKLHESGLRAAYYKAAMSGNDRDGNGALIPGDAAFVQSVSGISQPLETMCPHVYEHAYSPHLAAKVEGGPVCMDKVKAGLAALEARYDYITLEGSGGILCPLRHDGQTLWLEDAILSLSPNCLLVADAGLGAINAVGLTAFYMKSKGLPVCGVILNRFHPGQAIDEDNLLMCRELTGLPVLARVREHSADLDMTPGALAALYREGV